MTRARLVPFAVAGLLALPAAALLTTPAVAEGAEIVTSAAPGRVAFGLSDGNAPSGVAPVGALRDGSTLVSIGSRLLRIRADGTIDRAYGRAGTAQVGKDSACMRAEPSGRVLSVSDPEGAAPPEVRRYSSRGRLDAGFGRDGRVVLRDLRSLYACDRTSDGGLLLGGRARRITADTREALVRVTPSGRVDAGFGANGVRRLRGRRGIREVATRTDDTIMQVVPSIGGSGSGRKTLTRMAPGGRIEPFAALYPYDRNGALRVPGRLSEIELVQIDSHDRVLVLVRHVDRDRYLLRLRPDGTLDTSFGTNGHVPLGDLNPVDVFQVLEDDGVLVASVNGVSLPGADVETLRLTAGGQVAGRTKTPLPLGGGDENNIDYFTPEGQDAGTEWLTMAPLGGNLEVDGAAVHRDGSVMLGGSVPLVSYGKDLQPDRYAALLVAVGPNGQLAPGFGRATPLELGVTAPAQDYARKGLRIRFRPRHPGMARVQVFRDATVVAERMVPFYRARPVERRVPWTKAGRALADEPAAVTLRVEVEANDIPGNRVTRTVQTMVR